MNECTVISNFICKVTNEKYLIGDTYSGTLKRCKELELLGFVTDIVSKKGKQS